MRRETTESMLAARSSWPHASVYDRRPTAEHLTPGDKADRSWSPSVFKSHPIDVKITEEKLEQQDTAGRPFSSIYTECGFCLAMALTQFLGEYLISGFAAIWPSLKIEYNDPSLVAYWPASLLSLVLCSTILAFARVSDMYGGFYVCCFGIAWLAIWTLVAGFASSVAWMDVCRAMQGLAVAAYTPSCLALFSSIYPNGRRRNIMLGVYGACAPVGFFAGISVSAALPSDRWSFYFWIAAMLSAVSFVMLVCCTPRDRMTWRKNELSMDWAGTVAITAGLIMVVYSLSTSAETGWSSPEVLSTLIIGLACLCAAVYIEGWWAASPLVPAVFFKPKSVKAFMLAVLFFYGCFGVWLFTTTTFFETRYHATGLTLALWFLPMAIGGFAIAVFGSAVMHIVPTHYLLIFSGVAWVLAPLLLAVSNTATGYWPFPFPAMIAGTLGIDLTFTISVVYLSAAQPEHLQGLAGAACSILINLGISFALSFATIIETAVVKKSTAESESLKADQGHRAAFWFAFASAVVGLLIVLLFVRISAETTTRARGQPMLVDEEAKRRDSVMESELEAKTPTTVSTFSLDGADEKDDRTAARSRIEVTTVPEGVLIPTSRFSTFRLDMAPR